jgi:ABC-type glycerol-3-phosphate transport system permease component
MSTIETRSLPRTGPAVQIRAPRFQFSRQNALTYFMLALLVALVVVPFLWMLVGSFRPTYEHMQRQGTSLWIENPTTEN